MPTHPIDRGRNSLERRDGHLLARKLEFADNITADLLAASMAEPSTP